MSFDREAMRARFFELQRSKAEIHSKAAPFRDQMEQAAQAEHEAAARRRGFAAQAKEAEIGLFEIDQEIAFIARGLGNVGSDPTAS